MKPNTKSIAIVFFSLFFLAACSHARYGHLTRRVKADNPTSTEKVVKAKPEKTQPEQVIVSEDLELEDLDIMDIGSDYDFENDNSADRVIEPTKAEKVEKLKETTVKVSENFGTPLVNRFTQKTINKFEERAAEKNMDGDILLLLKIILIILLVLIIIDLLARFLPYWFKGVIGAIILIILIIWLLSYLGGV
jgi:Flp pilus assembly protein TadB